MYCPGTTGQQQSTALTQLLGWGYRQAGGSGLWGAAHAIPMGQYFCSAELTTLLVTSKLSHTLGYWHFYAPFSQLNHWQTTNVVTFQLYEDSLS